MRMMVKYSLVVLFIVIVSFGNGCMPFYVGKELPSLDWTELDSVENKQPIALYFGYMVYGGKEAYLSKMWERHFQRALQESGLFSSVIIVGLYDSKPSVQRLDLILTDQVQDAQQAVSTLVSSLSLLLIKTTQTSPLELSARYTNPGKIPTADNMDVHNYKQVREIIAGQGNIYNHTLYRTVGLIGSTPEGIKKSSGDEAAFQIAKDLTAYMLSDLQKKGYLK